MTGWKLDRGHHFVTAPRRPESYDDELLGLGGRGRGVGLQRRRQSKVLEISLQV